MQALDVTSDADGALAIYSIQKDRISINNGVAASLSSWSDGLGFLRLARSACRRSDCLIQLSDLGSNSPTTLSIMD